MNEEEMVLLVFKLYKKTALNRGWLCVLIDSILHGEKEFLAKLEEAKRVFHMCECVFKE